ncbi:MAG: hypothetical protein WEB60_02885 [Terrimicrobiaceae bacterium]
MPAAVLAAEKKAPLISVRIHAEGSEREGPSFVAPIDLAFPAKRIFIRKVPIISEKDITAILPFSSADGSLGCTLKLDANGAQKIEEHTTTARDTIVAALINGRIASALRVDRRITDGIITIPAGFTPEEILVLQTKHPTLGKEKEFESQKKQALASLSKAAAAKKKTEKKTKSEPVPAKES